MFLSYAQRLEDYHLALAFAGEPPGFYIDVGAGHPVADNVTFALHLAGWSGIAVEPQEQLARSTGSSGPGTGSPRPFSPCGRHGAFHVFETWHGLSTMRADRAREAQALGGPCRIVERPVVTLAALCAAEGVSRIDLLKIDVEGAEGEVLAGADFSRWRPRLILAETVSPGSPPGAPDWEERSFPAATASRFFDGLNRFYVAAEETALAARLPREPAPWDAVLHLVRLRRAPENPDHPDHALACRLVAGFSPACRA